MLRLVPVRSFASMAMLLAALGTAQGCQEGRPQPLPPVLVELRGNVSVSGGGGIEGATVTILDGANARRSARTNSNGEYAFTGLTPGNANLSASGSIYDEIRLGVEINGTNTLNFRFPVPQCQMDDTGSVSFGNRSATAAHDIIWDGIRVFTLTPGQTSDPIHAAAGVAHTLRIRIANTLSLACNDSSPVLTRCERGHIITCAGPLV